jgi:hypothetical protein
MYCQKPYERLQFILFVRAHQTRQNGRLFCPGNYKICNGPSNDKVQRNLQLARKHKWHRNNVEFLNDNIFTKFGYSDLKEGWNGENFTDWGIWEGDFIVTRAKKSSILPCLVSPDKKYKLQPFIGLLTIHLPDRDSIPYLKYAQAMLW